MTPETPAQPRWSDDGQQWWDGATWIPRDQVPARQAELAREEQARLAQERATYSARYAQWQAEQATADPFRPDPALPPAPPGVVPGATEDGPAPTGYALGFWSFAMAAPGMLVLLGVALALRGHSSSRSAVLFVVLALVSLLTFVPAVVLGHLSRRQARRARLNANIWSRWGLFFGYLELAVLSALVAVGAYVAQRDDLGPVGQSLKVAAKAEEAYRAYYGGYTGALSPAVFRPAEGVTVTVLRADTSSYCLRGTGYGRTLYLSSATGEVSRTPCR